MILVSEVEPRPEGSPPDIFRAARTNDVAELLDALAEGQTLNTQEPHMMMSPLHIAAAERSNDFLEEAVKHESCDSWLRDANQRVAQDHAVAYRNERGSDILIRHMYSDLYEHSDIDYTDNGPSPYYPAN